MTWKILIAAILLSTVQLSAAAQYYYKDILGNKQVLAERKAFEDQQKRTVDVKSFDGDGTESTDFFCEKKISKDYRKIETFTRSGSTGKSILTSYFDQQGLLTKTTDSSETNTTDITYQYDNKNNLSLITSVSRSNDDDFVVALTETRKYTYNDKGWPIEMLLTRNRKDSTEFDFTEDSVGNVIEEEEMADHGNHYYYYYNDNNMLTDIVRYNVAQQKAIPDFVFEYNSAGQIIQMIATEELVQMIDRKEQIVNNYLIWKYNYEDGLRTDERCFSKDKQLQGYFQYEYK
jgi:hypothetical protein